MIRKTQLNLVIVAALGLLGLCGSARAVEGCQPISHWKFDEGSGTTAYDSAGNYDGMLNGDPTWVAGQVGSYALDFDGDGDYVRTSYEGAPSEYTVALWYNLNEDIDLSTFTGWRALASKTGDEVGSVELWNIWFTVNGLALNNEKSLNNYASVAYKPEIFYKDEWHHVAATGTTVQGKIYFDGELRNTSNDDFVTGVWDDSVPFDIARAAGGPVNRFFNGKIDDVRIYDKVLSAEEIEELYEVGLGYVAFNPSPADGAKNVDPNAVLSWSPGKYATSHDVYFGTDYNDVNDADTDSGEFIGNQDANSYDAFGLEVGTIYYWRIDGKDALGTVKGHVWSFRTWIDPNLISWWKFDEREGDIAYDSAGGNDGAIHGAQWTTGQIDGALTFDGVDDYVDCGSDSSLDFGEGADFSIAFGFKVHKSSGTEGQELVVKREYKGYKLFYEDQPAHVWYKKIVLLIDLGPSNLGVASTTDVDDALWHHVVGVRTGTTFKLYLDGVQEGELSGAGYDGDLSNSSSLQISSDNGSFGGKIDDVRIYDTALSDEEIRELYYPFGVPAQPKYAGGTGEPNNPYRIETAEHLNDIGNHVEDFNKCFVLENDINLGEYTGMAFNIIGKYETTPFTGVFDGNGHQISNFTYIYTGSTVLSYVGLFGCVDGPNAEIRELGFISPYIDGRIIGGSLVCAVDGGTVSGCYVKDGYLSGFAHCGLLVGLNSGTVTNCYATGYVSGTHSGGLIGANWGEVSTCYFSGIVDGAGEHIGGLIGHNSSGATVTNCYSSGSVWGGAKVGGLVGTNLCCGDIIIERCYSTCSVSGDYDVGGLIGYNYGGSVDWSFWDVNTSGQTWSAGGIGKTTAKMQTESTFTDAGWDFDNIWRICEGIDYPRFVWQWCEKLADFDSNGFIDLDDLAVLVQAWLSTPPSPNWDETCELNCDCVVNAADFALLANKWLRDLDSPTVPENLRILDISETTVTLLWDASTDNIAVEGYNIYRDGDYIDSTTFTLYTDTDLTPNTLYTYTVSAYDAQNNESAQSDPLQIIYDTEAPSVPQNLQVTNETINEISLAWDASTDNVGIAGYNIYRDESLLDSTTDTFYTDSGLELNNIYTYKVSAYDTAGNESAQSGPAQGSTFDTETPSVPQNLAITGTTDTTVSLTWDASTDNVGVTGYNVYRDANYVDSTADIFYTDTGLDPDTAYTYTVSAYDAQDNESAQSDAVTTMPLGWSNQDIGSVGAAGTVSYDKITGTFTIEGAGTDIGGTADEFHYVYKPLAHNGQIIARITSIEQTSEWAKAGVMIRQSLTADSPHAMTLLMPGPDYGIAFYRRKTTAGATDVTFGSNVSAPYWVKLVRQGNSLSGYESSNGTNWVLVNTDTINMPNDVYIGLAVSGVTITGDVLCTATIDNVSIE